jgi:hypothetical protein
VQKSYDLYTVSDLPVVQNHQKDKKVAENKRVERNKK